MDKVDDIIRIELQNSRIILNNIWIFTQCGVYCLQLGEKTSLGLNKTVAWALKTSGKSNLILAYGKCNLS